MVCVAYSIFIASYDTMQLLFTSTAELILVPRIGNQLGGTPVLIRGFCLQPYDVITCLFDGIAGLGSYVNPSTALCVTPAMSSAGQVAMEMRIFNRTSRPVLSATFINGIILIATS